MVIEKTNASELIALLSEQCGLYAQLRDLAVGQRSLITGDRPELLLGVLGERQRLIERLEALSGRLRPYQNDWRAVRSGLSASDGRRVDQLVAEVNALLKGILEKDAADAELLAARKSETALRVQSARAVRQAGAAYAASGDVPGGAREWTEE